MSSLRIPVQKSRSDGKWQAIALARVEFFNDSSRFSEGCRALIDTGATDSGVSANLARTLNLPPDGSGSKVATVSHPEVWMPSHHLLITLPFLKQFDIFTAYEFPGGLKGVDVIIGMDIIMQTDCVIRSREGVIEMFLPREEGIFRRRFIRL